MKNKMNFGSIKSQLICYVVAMVVIVCAGIALISYNVASSALTSALDASLLEITREGAQVVEERMNGYFNQLDALTTNSLFQTIKANQAKIQVFLSKQARKYSYLNMFVADTTGTTTDGTNISDTPYFQKAISGENTVTDPSVNTKDGSMIIQIIVPIKDDTGAVIGVLVAVRDASSLTELISDITYGESGNAFLINSTGTTIAHSDESVVLNKENTLEMVKDDPSLSELAALEKKMCAGEQGTGKYKYQGVTKYMGYYPVSIENWSIGLSAPKNEVFGQIQKLELIMAAISAVFIALSVVGAIFIARSLSDPIKRAVACADQMAQGDLTFRPEARFLKRRDEIGTLANAFNKISENMSDVLSNINAAAAQVSAGAAQVAETSSSLSQSSTEQASSAEQLSASIEQISVQTNLNAQHAEQASKIAETARHDAEKGNEQMKDMLQAMDEIRVSSDSISRIIKVIDDIAFQTSILALNAAIEAARAGQHGKGFSVVAEEVRTLAARSADAAKETTQMIEGSIKSVESGTRIAQETSDALHSIVGSIENVANLVKDIAVASDEQATGVAQVTQGIEQVSTVIQSNTAVSEESASSSEEMSAQAKLLEQQVRRFRLRGVSIMPEAVEIGAAPSDDVPKEAKRHSKPRHKKRLSKKKDLKLQDADYLEMSIQK